HITNIYKEGELEESATVAKYATVQNEKGRYVERQIEFYNLDMIISVGYRVKSKRGILFRQWATKTLKEYLLKGYVVNQRFERIEQRVTETEKKIDFFVRTALPPVEGIFYDGQVFDAYKFASDLIKSAKNSIILIDNYIDESVLMLLSKRATGIDASIYTSHISRQLQLDLQRHNAQYQHISIDVSTRVHDRFLFIDNDVYHIGASLKDLGKKLFAFSKLELKAQGLLENII
ncbi:MAG: virulence RhuM family protein, partial [Candidatus Symbiothrix sp.]|nr:virulence RhuM family protein [Candidatus Symbiothrix sp.]